jgi:hypothetical protein
MACKASMHVSQTLQSSYLSHAASTQADEHQYPMASTAETRYLHAHDSVYLPTCDTNLGSLCYLRLKLETLWN